MHVRYMELGMQRNAGPEETLELVLKFADHHKELVYRISQCCGRHWVRQIGKEVYKTEDVQDRRCTR